jgi:hypothetical protein
MTTSKHPRLKGVWMAENLFLTGEREEGGKGGVGSGGRNSAFSKGKALWLGRSLSRLYSFKSRRMVRRLAVLKRIEAFSLE